MGVELVAKIERGENPVRDQILAQPGNVVTLEVFEDAVAVLWPLHGPVDVGRAQVRYRRQHVMTGTAFRRQRRIGDARRVQVEREIVSQGLALEDLIDQFAVARPEAHRVVLQMFVTALEAEMNYEQRHGKALAGKPFGFVATTLFMPEQLLVGIHHIGIRRHRICDEAAPVPGDHGPCQPTGKLDARDLGVQFQLAAQVFEQPDHPLYQRSSATAWKPHATLPLQRVDQRIDGGGLERVTAHQQRVE